LFVKEKKVPLTNNTVSKLRHTQIPVYSRSLQKQISNQVIYLGTSKSTKDADEPPNRGKLKMPFWPHEESPSSWSFSPIFLFIPKGDERSGGLAGETRTESSEDIFLKWTKEDFP
jgi:hypothetical protein